jgi:hypothetical protein
MLADSCNQFFVPAWYELRVCGPNYLSGTKDVGVTVAESGLLEIGSMEKEVKYVVDIRMSCCPESSGQGVIAQCLYLYPVPARDDPWAKSRGSDTQSDVTRYLVPVTLILQVWT